MKELTIEEVAKILKQIETGEIKYEDPSNVIVYSDFDKMVTDMKKHVVSTGHKLIIQDQPIKLRLGFADNVDGSKWFVIGIAALKKWQNSIVQSDPLKVDLIKRALKSEAGKQNLLSIINGE
jgi:hypothetical protein